MTRERDVRISVGDPDPDPHIFTGIQIRKRSAIIHADLIFADLKYTFKIWVISREIRPLAALYPPPPYKKSAL